MRRSDDVVRYSEAHGVNNRIAAYMLAIDRVAYTSASAGFMPKELWSDGRLARPCRASSPGAPSDSDGSERSQCNLEER